MSMLEVSFAIFLVILANKTLDFMNFINKKSRLENVDKKRITVSVCFGSNEDH